MGKAWNTAKDILAIREIIRMVTGQESFFNVLSTKTTKLALLKFYDIMPEEEKRTPTMEDIKHITAAVKMLDKNQQETIVSVIGGDDSSDGGNILKLFAAIIRAEGEEALVAFLKNGFVKESLGTKFKKGASSILDDLEELGNSPSIKDKVEKFKLEGISGAVVRELRKRERSFFEKWGFFESIAFFSVMSMLLYFAWGKLPEVVAFLKTHANPYLLTAYCVVASIAVLVFTIRIIRSPRRITLRHIIENSLKDNSGASKTSGRIHDIIKNYSIAHLLGEGLHNNEIINKLTEKNLEWIYEDTKIKFINSSKKVGWFFTFLAPWIILVLFNISLNILMHYKIIN